MLPAPEAHLGHLWHEAYLERGLCRGRVQGSAEQHVPRAWGGVGEGRAQNSLKWRRMRKRKLSWRGVGAGLRESGIPSLPLSPSIGADETYPPVCVMKSSRLTTSLPILELLPPTWRFSPPWSPPLTTPLTTQKQERSWRCAEPWATAGAARPHAFFLRQLSLHQEQSQIPEPRLR